MPEGRSWLHEAKYDGYRILARKSGDEVTLFSRSGLDRTVRFPAIAKAVQKLPCKAALLDGEIAFVLPSGITDFKSLQEHIDTNTLLPLLPVRPARPRRQGLAARAADKTEGASRRP